MRRLGLSDLDKAARAVAAQPAGQRADFARRLLEDAHTADKWRKRRGKAHPNGGTGSLYAQAALYPEATPDGCDAVYCDALSHVLSALRAWRGRGHHAS